MRSLRGPQSLPLKPPIARLPCRPSLQIFWPAEVSDGWSRDSGSEITPSRFGTLLLRSRLQYAREPAMTFRRHTYSEATPPTKLEEITRFIWPREPSPTNRSPLLRDNRSQRKKDPTKSTCEQSNLTDRLLFTCRRDPSDRILQNPFLVELFFLDPRGFCRIRRSYRIWQAILTTGAQRLGGRPTLVAGLHPWAIIGT